MSATDTTPQPPTPAGEHHIVVQPEQPTRRVVTNAERLSGVIQSVG